MRALGYSFTKSHLLLDLGIALVAVLALTFVSWVFTPEITGWVALGGLVIGLGWACIEFRPGQD